MVEQRRAIFFAASFIKIIPLINAIFQKDFAALFDIGLINLPRARLALSEITRIFVGPNSKHFELVRALVFEFELAHITSLRRGA